MGPAFDSRLTQAIPFAMLHFLYFLENENACHMNELFILLFWNEYKATTGICRPFVLFVICSAAKHNGRNRRQKESGQLLLVGKTKRHL